MRSNRIKLLAIVSFVLPVMVFSVLFRSTPAAAVTPAAEDPAAVYKVKCAMCHGPKSEKAYDPTLPEEQQIEAILKGKKAAKPPHMPAFEPKGMTVEEATALVKYMQELRKPAQ